MKGRRIGVAALLVLATLLWTAAGFSVWAKRQALDTDNWVNTSSELLEDEEIRTALGVFIVNELFQSAEVQTRIEEALPTQLQPLAGPAAAGLKEVAQRSAPDLLGSAPALQAWETANEVAHSKLVAVVEGTLQDQGVALELKTLFQQIADSTGLPPDLADRLPPEVASLQVVKPDELETAQKAVDLFETLVWVLVVLAVLAFAGAIALSPDRRRTVVTVGGCLVFAGVAIFAFRRLAEKAVVDALADSPNASAIGDNVWEISTSLLAEVAQGTLLFGLFVMAGAWLAGAGRRATALRRMSAYALREHPGWTRAALGALILLLVIWGPVPWTQRFWTILIFTVLAFAWLEWLRRRTVEEFPDQPPPRRPSLRLPGRGGGDRASELERLADLRERGVLDQAEFEREKAALLAGGASP
jgi:Short C-terminal domain